MHFILRELTFEDNSPVAGSVRAQAVLCTVDELPLIFGAVSPTLNASTMLLIVGPFALVGASVLEDILAITVRTILHPLALVDVPTSSHKLASSFSPASDEVALVPRTVYPGEDPSAVALRALPLALVFGTSFNLDLWEFLEVIILPMVVRPRALWAQGRRRQVLSR
jgi:hypothetical protein